MTVVSYTGMDEGDYATIECGNGTMYFESTGADYKTRINVTCVIVGVEAIWDGLNATVCKGKCTFFVANSSVPILYISP